MIFGFVAAPGKLEDYLKWAGKNGFSHIEIDGTIPSNFLDQFPESRVESVRKHAEQLGISLSYHSSYGINLADPFREIRNAGRDLVRRCIDLSEKLEAEWVTIHPGYKIGWSDQKSDRITYFVESLRYLLELAEKRGIMIAVENLNKLTKGEVFYLGDCFSELQQIFGSSKSKLLRMTLDFGHAHLGEGVEEYLRTFAGRIICTHIHDNAGQGVDEHLPIGKGSIDWEKICTVIKEVDYRGPLCFEVYSDEAKLEGKNILTKYLI